MSETLMIGNPCEGERRPGAVGPPLRGRARIVDGEGKRGGGCVVGELLVRRRPLLRLLAAARRHRRRVHAGWFLRTGDLAERAADGYVRCAAARAT